MIAAKFRKAWRGLIVAMAPCITLCLFLGCVLLIHSSFGWFCGQLGRWAACSLQLFCHAFVGRLASLIQKDGIRNKRGPIGLGNTAFEGLEFLKPAVSYLIKTWFNVQCTTRSACEKATPPKFNFGHKDNSWMRGQSWNLRKYYAMKIWSYTVFGNTYEFNIYLAAIVSGWTDSGSPFIGRMLGEVSPVFCCPLWIHCTCSGSSITCGFDPVWHAWLIKWHDVVTITSSISH